MWSNFATAIDDVYYRCGWSWCNKKSDVVESATVTAAGVQAEIHDPEEQAALTKEEEEELEARLQKLMEEEEPSANDGPTKPSANDEPTESSTDEPKEWTAAQIAELKELEEEALSAAPGAQGVGARRSVRFDKTAKNATIDKVAFENLTISKIKTMLPFVDVPLAMDKLLRTFPPNKIQQAKKMKNDIVSQLQVELLGNVNKNTRLTPNITKFLSLLHYECGVKAEDYLPDLTDEQKQYFKTQYHLKQSEEMSAALAR